MSNIRFVVFHAGFETLGVYKPLMRASRDALAVTNPGARYVVLTDLETAPYLEKEFEVEACAPSGIPLMPQYVAAQMNYESRAEPGLTVLAATDCVANRDLNDSCPHNMAVTYRLAGRHLINNIAYVNDHDRAAWFLKRALDLIPPEEQDIWGDQSSWQAALGPVSTWESIDPVGKRWGIRRASPEGRWIHLYPCRTHNSFAKHTGAFRRDRGYLIHFKGSRKQKMVEAINWLILCEANGIQKPKQSPFKDKNLEKEYFPMQDRAGWRKLQGKPKMQFFFAADEPDEGE